MRRASVGGTSSWPTWTPSAPASRARSGRSLRMKGTPRSAQTRRTTRARASSGRASSTLSRSWTTSTPPPDAGGDEALEVGSVGGAEVEPAVGQRAAHRLRRRLSSSRPSWSARSIRSRCGLRCPGLLSCFHGLLVLADLGQAGGVDDVGYRQIAARPPRTATMRPPSPTWTTPSCLPRRATKIRAFCSPNPGRAFTRSQQFLAVGCALPDLLRRRRRIRRRRCGTAPGPGRPWTPGTGGGQASGEERSQGVGIHGGDGGGVKRGRRAGRPARRGP